MSSAPRRTSKKGESAKRTNAKAIERVFAEEGHVFGRVEKAFGSGMFQVLRADGQVIKAGVRGLFRKSAVRVGMGDIVLLSDVENTSIHEINAVIDRPSAARLAKLNRLPSGLLGKSDEEEQDEFFEFEELTEVDVDAI
jgi:translation initiation factor IF-1